MMHLKYDFQKERSSFGLGLLIILVLAGVVLRFLYVWEVGQHPVLNQALPETDQFMFDLMARNLNHSHPFDIKTPISWITVNFISLIYRLFEAGPYPIYMTFFVLSMMSAVFLSAVGYMIFGNYSGLLAGICWMYYRMNFFYDGLISKTALSQFLLIMVLFSFVAYVKTRRRALYVFFLVFSLLLCLMRVFYWFLIIPAILYCIIRYQHWKRVFFVAAYAALFVLAAAGFHYFHSADGYTHKFGVHFYIGNHAGAGGVMSAIPGIPPTSEGFAKDTILKAFEETGSPDHLNWYWIRKTIGSYQDESDSWFGVMLKKLSYVTNNYEPHNISSVYYYEKYTHLKYFPRLNIAVVLSLAAVGMFIVFSKRHKGGLVLFLPTFFVLVMVVSVFICSRYRMPLIPFLCLYAGFGIWQVCVCIGQKKYKVVGSAFLIGLATMFWANHPIAIFQKEKDIQVWEKEAKKAWKYSADVAVLRKQYKKWDSLDYEHKIFLTIQFENYRMPYEFKEAYQTVMPLTKGDKYSQNILLRQWARFEEKNFNFQKALELWEQLEQDSYWHMLAREKIREIKIVGPLLDRDFINE